MPEIRTSSPVLRGAWTLVGPAVPVAFPTSTVALDTLAVASRAFDLDKRDRLEVGFQKVASSGRELLDAANRRATEASIRDYLDWASSLDGERGAAPGTRGKSHTFDPEDGTSKLVARTPAAPEPFTTIFMHHGWDREKEPFVSDEGSFTPRQVAGKIADLDLPAGSPILLLSCRAGYPAEDGGPSSAEIIARRSGHPVVACSAWVKTDEGTFYANQKKPGFPKEWRIFYPDGSNDRVWTAQEFNRRRRESLR